MLRVLIYCVLFALVPVVAWFVTRRVSRYERRLVGVVLVVVPTSLITFIMVVTGHGHGHVAVLSADYGLNTPMIASTPGSVPEVDLGQTSSAAPPLVRAEPAPPVVAPSVVAPPAFGPPVLGPAVARTSQPGGRADSSGPTGPVVAPANLPGPVLSVPLPTVALPSISPIKPPPPKPSPPSGPTTNPPTTKPTTPPAPPPSSATDAPAPATEPPPVTTNPPTSEAPPPAPPPTSDPATSPVDTLVGAVVDTLT